VYSKLTLVLLLIRSSWALAYDFFPFLKRPLSVSDHRARHRATDRNAAAAAGIETKIGCHSFRATGITAYLKNGGTLERAAAMANHASTRTTQLYDRRNDEMSLDEVERIAI
jgi:integrase